MSKVFLEICHFKIFRKATNSFTITFKLIFTSFFFLQVLCHTIVNIQGHSITCGSSYIERKVYHSLRSLLSALDSKGKCIPYFSTMFVYLNCFVYVGYMMNSFKTDRPFMFYSVNFVSYANNGKENNLEELEENKKVKFVK